MRWDALGAMGNRIIRTPNLDRLAYEGVLFLNNFVTTSICPTSRASIFTGQYGRRHQIWDFETPFTPQQFQQTYPALLRAAGYRTAFIGKWGLGGDLPSLEFDYWQGFAGQGQYFEKNRKKTFNQIINRTSHRIYSDLFVTPTILFILKL
ncbi:MAG: sulfatase-like hydrolase/transferase [Hydrococcus sp. CSU_1_8]|nr:sulfatase-like hydrolase/transferase [Hydrococcus sp. CSU_1_8]